MSLETESTQTKNNLVLRKLLRQPRYFDSIGSWGQVCEKCCDEDHITGDCNIQKRKKPCFICGRSDHSGKIRKKKKGCFNCNLSHLPNVCLEKDPKVDQKYIICLRCGESGHIMVHCNNDFSPDDLKQQIKCLICNEFGHLSCAEYVDVGSRQVSCYKCGELGHMGSGCPLMKRCPNQHAPSVDYEAATFRDSYGEEGQIVIDCQKRTEEDDERVGNLGTFSNDKEDQLGTEICKGLLKQNDAEQGSSTNVLVQV